MKQLLLLLFVFQSVFLPAQHRRFLPVRKKSQHHFVINGTWLVTREKVVSISYNIDCVFDSLHRTYYRFGDPMKPNSIAIMTFDHQKGFALNNVIVDGWTVSDTLGRLSGVDPVHFEWYGHYCGYEGYGRMWEMQIVNDSEMVFVSDWLQDGNAPRFDSLWLKKMNAVDSTVIVKSGACKGKWSAVNYFLPGPDSLGALPMNYLRTMEIEFGDSSFTQRVCRKLTKGSDTVSHYSSVSILFHYEDFMGNLLLVSDDRKAIAWIVPLSATECWISIERDCDSMIFDGSYLFRRIN